jgi:hypothetical protein
MGLWNVRCFLGRLRVIPKAPGTKIAADDMVGEEGLYDDVGDGLEDERGGQRNETSRSNRICYQRLIWGCEVSACITLEPHTPLYFKQSQA